MSNSFYEAFQKARCVKPRSNILFSLSTCINNYERFCIVEGVTDKPFYSNIKDTRLDVINTRYLWNVKEDYDAGKDAVISAYNNIVKEKNFEKIRKYMYKCVFIIDKDYDGAKSMTYEYNPMLEKCMCITKGYSMENYFLTENNVSKIFNYLKLSNNDLNRFEEKYNQFIKESMEYFRLKSSLIELKKKGSLCYDKNGKDDSKIMEFKFNFDAEHYNDDYYNKEKMQDEIEKMKVLIKQHRNMKALDYYNKHSKKIISQRDNLRGHDAMHFLMAYLNDVFGIILLDCPANGLFKKLAKILDVDMRFVNGIGEEI